MSKKLAAILQLDPGQTKEAKALRTKSIDDAVLLPGGPSREKMKHHVLWSGHGYEVGVGKPGKETVTKNVINPNVNDMWPFIQKDNIFEDKSASFDDIFYELEHMGNRSRYSLELLGCLLARSAFMLDHEIIDGKVVYVPPKVVMDEISKDITTMFKVPLGVFLQYLEAIALNEDVKYQRRLNTKGKPYAKAAGRPNNLLTCAHLIAVLLGKTSVVGFATGFAKKRGVSPLDVKQLTGCFPMLDIDKSEAKIISEELEEQKSKPVR
ncbi:MAG: hypothetical protein Q8P56_01705 [Candidatus Uhrbacteria bacterium]|nr:hypothetical protein [Candidatus Uhrbacteria bacterium]